MNETNTQQAEDAWGKMVKAIRHSLLEEIEKEVDGTDFHVPVSPWSAEFYRAIDVMKKAMLAIIHKKKEELK